MFHIFDMDRNSDFVEVRDRVDGKFYKCKIIKRTDDLYNIHFVGWGARYDEWIDADSERIRGNFTQEEQEGELDEASVISESSMNDSLEECEEVQNKRKRSESQDTVPQNHKRPSVQLSTFCL